MRGPEDFKTCVSSMKSLKSPLAYCFSPDKLN